MREVRVGGAVMGSKLAGQTRTDGRGWRASGDRFGEEGMRVSRVENIEVRFG